MRVPLNLIPGMKRAKNERRRELLVAKLMNDYLGPTTINVVGTEAEVEEDGDDEDNIYEERGGGGGGKRGKQINKTMAMVMVMLTLMIRKAPER